MNFNTYLADIGESECSKERRDELYREFIKLSKNTSQKAIRLRIKRFEIVYNEVIKGVDRAHLCNNLGLFLCL